MMRKGFIAAAAAALALVAFARATQNELVPPTSGIYTGVQFSQKIGDAFRSLASCNKGSVAPANVGGSVVDGLCWIDDSASPWVIKQYTNGGWAIVGALNPTDSSYLGVIGGGAPASIDSATGPVIDIGAVPQSTVNITGTSTLTGLGGSAPTGVIKVLRFAAALKLTNSNALTVPGGFDLTTAAGDRAIVEHLGSGNWEVTSYTRASGIPIDITAVGKPDFTFQGSMPPLHLAADGSPISRASYPAYFAKVTRAQNGTRTSGNATIAGLTLTQGFGAGMPVESTGVAGGCTIASVASNAITLNSPSCVTASGTSTVTVFLTGYGSGGNSSTVGLPDCQGRAIAGLDNGVGRLTAAIAGGDPNAYNSSVGLQSVTMALANLIQHTHSNTLSDPGHGHPGSTGLTQGLTLTGNANLSNAAFNGKNDNASINSQLLTIASNTTGVTINNAAAGSASPTPMRTVPPMLIAPCIIRVIP